jgi:hypothetical protein
VAADAEAYESVRAAFERGIRSRSGRSITVAFDNLIPQSREYITTLAGNVIAGTHTNKITRLSGSVNDPRARIVQKATPGNTDYTLFLEGYGSGEAVQRLVVKGYLTGEWADVDTWEGTVEDSAITEMQAG